MAARAATRRSGSFTRSTPRPRSVATLRSASRNGACRAWSSSASTAPSATRGRTAAHRKTRLTSPRSSLVCPAHQLDLLAYFKFLFDCVGDGRFTVDNVMAAMDAQAKLSPIERVVFTIAMPRVRQETLRLKALAQFMIDHPSGPGRIDTFTPYKTMQFGYRQTAGFAVGNADLPSIWNQGIREGMFLHWDGNNPSLFERNISAAIGAGATPVSLDVPRMNRVADWLRDLPPPVYPQCMEARRRAGQEGGRNLSPAALLRLPWTEGRTVQESPGGAGCAHQVDQDRQ